MQKRLASLDAHNRLILGVVVALITFFSTLGHLKVSIQSIAVWNAFAWTIILLSWIRIVFADARTSVQAARLQDTTRSVIFLFVILAAVTSLFAVAILIGAAKGLGRRALTEHLILAGATVLSSWFLIHTVFAMHYAHAYYRDRDDDPNTIEGAGLDFPNQKEPDFLDFAYFSFVIGMTCQVSDVQVTSQSIRRLALVHGLLSFLFNTVILALSINLASSLV
ncbi:MAG TPA: DUF1345 domain-containing protein [Chthoniobacterales bacterium]|jgi:uncharacterized membrane protein|nr:DUF1345 domain-containing protein [Chthoniobacterales bacterium]